MKNAILNSKFLAFALCLSILPSLTSCKKDKVEAPKPTVREQLVSDWEIKSFTIDGVEVKGSIVNSSKMEFEAYTGTDGDFKWTINFADGTTETETGDYTVDVEDKEIDLVNEAGEHLQFDFDLDGDDLELSGTLDGERYILKAERD